MLAKEVAKRIEKEMEYPGQIRVNVIRETRSTEYAKYQGAASLTRPRAPKRARGFCVQKNA